MNAIPQQHDHGGGLIARVLKRTVIVKLALMGMAPQHELFKDEKQQNPRRDRKTHERAAAATCAFNRLGQKTQERSPQKRPGGEAHEVRQESVARGVRQEEHGARHRSARNAAQGREGENPGEYGQALLLHRKVHKIC
jgi:hypothetical protein